MPVKEMMPTPPTIRRIVDGSEKRGAASALDFVLPAELEATTPPELRGLRRDHVRLMVLDKRRGATLHSRFDSLPDYLRAGDLLVLNTSRTLPALLQATDEVSGVAVEVRLAHHRDGLWQAILLDGRRHIGRADMRLRFAGGLRADVVGHAPGLSHLWLLRFNRDGAALLDAMYRIGQPVRYSYVAAPLPLDMYQTVYADQPGSVEMPSAGRPLSWSVLRAAQRKGVGIATLVLHCGLSSTRDDTIDATHPNEGEEYSVPEATASAINRTHAAGGRVIAVGTTVVRALETVTDAEGQVRAGSGWTQLYITPNHRLRAVDGLLTGMHEPQATHLDMLSAFIRPNLLGRAYAEAIARGYLWHEFGDSNLIV